MKYQHPQCRTASYEGKIIQYIHFFNGRELTFTSFYEKQNKNTSFTTSVQSSSLSQGNQQLLTKDDEMKEREISLHYSHLIYECMFYSVKGHFIHRVVISVFPQWKKASDCWDTKKTIFSMCPIHTAIRSRAVMKCTPLLYSDINEASQQIKWSRKQRWGDV